MSFTALARSRKLRFRLPGEQSVGKKRHDAHAACAMPHAKKSDVISECRRAMRAKILCTPLLRYAPKRQHQDAAEIRLRWRRCARFPPPLAISFRGASEYVELLTYRQFVWKIFADDAHATAMKLRAGHDFAPLLNLHLARQAVADIINFRSSRHAHA